jgi:hypothetical protein
LGIKGDSHIDAFIAQRAKGSTFAEDRRREESERAQAYLSERVEAQTYQAIAHANRLARVHAELAEQNRERAVKLAERLPTASPGGEGGER